MPNARAYIVSVTVEDPGCRTAYLEKQFRAWAYDVPDLIAQIKLNPERLEPPLYYLVCINRIEPVVLEEEKELYAQR